MKFLLSQMGCISKLLPYKWINTLFSYFMLDTYLNANFLTISEILIEIMKFAEQTRTTHIISLFVAMKIWRYLNSDHALLCIVYTIAYANLRDVYTPTNTHNHSVKRFALRRFFLRNTFSSKGKIKTPYSTTLFYTYNRMWFNNAPIVLQAYAYIESQFKCFPWKWISCWSFF